MTIQEILEDHEEMYYNQAIEVAYCACDTPIGSTEHPYEDNEKFHRAHVAEVLEKHMREREAGALESFVASQRQMLENMEPFADEYDRDEVDRWCSVISNRAKEIRECTDGR